MTKMARLLRVAAAVVAPWSGSIGAERNSPLGLPAEFAGYRQWTQLLKSPYQVPMELWALCRAPTPADWGAARQKYGPHTERFIRVYGNQAAVAAISDREKEALPTGSRNRKKEKFSRSPHGAPEGVAFMIKRKASQFPTTAGWEFLYFPSSGDDRRTHEACASCHRAAAPNDYVFGHYPR
jgi:hypothetical protein